MKKRDIPNRVNATENTPNGRFTLVDKRNTDRLKKLHSSKDHAKSDRNYTRNLRIIYDYISGHSVTKLSAKYDLSTSTLYTILHRYQIELRPSDKKTNVNDTKRLIVQLISAGKSIDEVAQQLRLPQEIVSGVVNARYAELQKQEEIERERNRKSDERYLEDDNAYAPSKKLKPMSPLPSGRLVPTRESKFSPLLSEKIAKHKGYFVNHNAKFSGEANKPSPKEYSAIMTLIGQESVSLTKTERLIMDLLRASLEYSAANYNITDYSKDPYLVPDFLLPLDIMIQKDIIARYAEGESTKSIARHHRLKPKVVTATVSGALNREEFRTELFASLNRFITTDLV